MNRSRRNVLLLASIGGLMLFLSVAPGCCRKCIGTREKATTTDNNTARTELPGVTVTGEVPHSTETIPEIKDRETTHPLPARGDRAIHSHKIPRTMNDNCMSIPAGGDPTAK